MSADELEAVIQVLNSRQPFRPYQVEMLSGDRFVIHHPETIVRTETFFVYRGTDSGHRIFTGASQFR